MKIPPALTPSGCWPKEPALDGSCSAARLCEILAGPRRLPVTGIILEITPTGAILEVGTRLLPRLFLLRNEKWEHGVVCEMIWQSGCQLGVRFMSHPDRFPQPDSFDMEPDEHLQLRHAG